MKTLAAAVFIACMLSSMPASAACSDNACSSTVTRLYVKDRKNANDLDLVYVQLADTVQDKDKGAAAEASMGCALVSKTYFILREDHPAFDQIYATLLTALVSKTIVKIRRYDDLPYCTIEYVVIHQSLP